MSRVTFSPGSEKTSNAPIERSNSLIAKFESICDRMVTISSTSALSSDDAGPEKNPSSVSKRDSSERELSCCGSP